MEIPVSKLAYGVEEFADAVSIARSAVYVAIRDGKLKTFKAGRRRLVSADAAREFIRALETKSEMRA